MISCIFHESGASLSVGRAQWWHGRNRRFVLINDCVAAPPQRSFRWKLGLKACPGISPNAASGVRLHFPVLIRDLINYVVVAFR